MLDSSLSFASISDFHFIRPWALLLLPALLLLCYAWMRKHLSSSQWQSILPAHLHRFLVSSKGDRQSKQPFIWLMIALALASFALAGPAWQKLPQPVYQTESGRVLVIDMSLSMRATDISPSRLARAKFKAIDLVNEINDGEVGLVAYAGDAFTISPLTQDVSNLENLIPALSPDIMPSSGSSPLRGLRQAQELLENAGYQYGHIYWITDGIEFENVKGIRDFINQSNFEFSALLIGTEEGAPIQLQDGSLLKGRNGAIVIPQSNYRYLQQALAPSNAKINRMSIDGSDIETMLLSSQLLEQQRAQDSEQGSGDAFEDMGVYLAILILPIAALLFRKGLLFTLCVASLVSLSALSGIGSRPAIAQSLEPSSVDEQNRIPAEADDSITQRIESAFLNDNQKAKQAFEQGQFDKAQSLFKDTKWRAAAAYKAGDYEQALGLYQQSEGLDSIYNRGNALAQLGQLQKAIDAYDKVLKMDPGHKEAAKNKAIVEDMLEQQEKAQDKQNQDSQGEQEQEQNQDGESSESDPQGEQGQQDQQDQSSQDQQEQNQQGQNQQEQDGQQDASDNASQEPSGPEQQENSDEGQGSEHENEQENEQNEEQFDEAQGAGQGEEQAPDSEQVPPESVQAVRESELSPEEREQMQRLQTLMNKVPDDPAFLLQRKMMIEAQKRKQYAPPQNQEQEW